MDPIRSQGLKTFGVSILTVCREIKVVVVESWPLVGDKCYK